MAEVYSSCLLQKSISDMKSGSKQSMYFTIMFILGVIYNHLIYIRIWITRGTLFIKWWYLLMEMYFFIFYWSPISLNVSLQGYILDRVLIREEPTVRRIIRSSFLTFFIFIHTLLEKIILTRRWNSKHIFDRELNPWLPQAGQALHQLNENEMQFLFSGST